MTPLQHPGHFYLGTYAKLRMRRMEKVSAKFFFIWQHIKTASCDNLGKGRLGVATPCEVACSLEGHTHDILSLNYREKALNTR